MSLLLLGNKKKKDIVKNGLVLWLDGKDFTNSPPTNLWKDRSLCNKLTYATEVPYIESTWAEWALASNVPVNGNPTVNNNNLTFTVSAGTTNGYCRVGMSNTNIKPSTEYGVLVNVPINTINTVFKLEGQISNSDTIIPSNATGNSKAIFTTLANIKSNVFGMYCWNAVTGGVIKMNSIRVFELPVGSLIEYDFTNLSADQLNLKYPMKPKGQSVIVNRGNDAITRGMAYTSVSGSNNNGGVVFDGVDDKAISLLSMSQNSYTIQAKIKISNHISWGALVGLASEGGTRIATLYMDQNAGSLSFTTNNNVNLSFNYNINTIMNITMMFNGATKKVFVDGVQVASSVGTPTITSVNKICVGTSESTVNFGKHVCYSVKVYDRALTDAEIKQNYNASK